MKCRDIRGRKKPQILSFKSDDRLIKQGGSLTSPLGKLYGQRHNMLILRGFPKLVNFAHPVVLKTICLQQIQNWGKSILIESQIQLCPALGRRP